MRKFQRPSSIFPLERYIPFGYQQNSIDAGLAWFDDPKTKTGVIVDPVAGGKSLEIAEMAIAIANRGHKVLILQPREELIRQNALMTYRQGGECTIFCAGVGEKVLSNIVFGTLDSVRNLGKEFREYGIGVVLIDECHFGFSESKKVPSKPKSKDSSYRKFIAALNPKKVIGFTATPVRLYQTREGAVLKMINRVMHKLFKDIIHVNQIDVIRQAGRWSELKYQLYHTMTGRCWTTILPALILPRSRCLRLRSRTM